MNAWEREEEQLEEDLAAGLITHAEYSKAIRELHRDYREAAQDAAWEAGQRELENW